MILRCPACGAESSLDALINQDDAGRIMAALASIGTLGNPVIQYLALFRPEKRRLAFSRVAALLDELTPAMRAQRIERDGRVHDAPLAAWAAGFEKCLQARDAGTLRTPLKSHGYLFEIVIAEAARGAGVAVVTDRNQAEGLGVPPTSATARSMVALNERRR